ncbi:MAG TPA: ROK family protein [Candidatus Nanopelagicaceae bacterium]
MLTQASVIALDAGGTEIKAGFVRGLEILDEKRWPTERELGPEHARDQILLAAREMHKMHPTAKAVGLVVPGVVDVNNGIAIYSENIKWRDIPFGKLINELTGLPVGFGHDVRAGGIAEARFGSSIGYRNSLFLPIGTGICGAIIIDGKLLEDIYAGEIGHMDVDSGYLCACGSIGCLESISTGPSITRIYGERSGKTIANSAAVLKLAKSGDQIASQVWQDATNALAKALFAYITILAPEVIVLGGGVSKAGADLIDPIEKYFDSKITIQRRPLLKIAALGDSAGMIGAGILGAGKLD